MTWLPGKTGCFGRGVNDGCIRIALPVLDLTLPAAIVHDGRVSTAERRRIAMMGSRELGRATMRRSMIVLLVALVASLAFGQPIALARQNAADWSKWTGAPGPEECVTGPVDSDTFVDDLIAAAATPQADDVPLAVESIDDLPAGKAPSDEEAEGALTTVRELLACANAGKFGSLLALFTPVALARLLFGATGLDAATMNKEELKATFAILTMFVELPATPVADELQAELGEIQDVRRLPDGRILVVATGTATDTEGAFYAILKKFGNRWLIDAAGTIGEVEVPALTS